MKDIILINKIKIKKILLKFFLLSILMGSSLNASALTQFQCPQAAPTDFIPILHGYIIYLKAPTTPFMRWYHQTSSGESFNGTPITAANLVAVSVADNEVQCIYALADAGDNTSFYAAFRPNTEISQYNFKLANNLTVSEDPTVNVIMTPK